MDFRFSHHRNRASGDFGASVDIDLYCTGPPEADG
jgi:hypothetical protein